MQRRHAVGFAVEHVELVRQLVRDDVESLAPAALLDLAPRENDGPLLPRLAAQHVVAGVHDAVLVDDLAVPHDEFVGMDDDRREARVAVDSELENR